MVKLCDWVKKTRKEACEECSSKEDLRVIRSGKTLCIKCYYKYHNRNKPKRVSGKPKERPVTPNSKRARLWAEIERQREVIQSLGQELVTLKCQMAGV